MPPSSRPLIDCAPWRRCAICALTRSAEMRRCNSRLIFNGTKEPSMRTDHRQRLLGIVAIAIVALFALDRLLLTPLVETWKSRSAAVAQLRKSIVNGKMLIQRESHTRRAWDEIRQSTLPVSASEAEKELLAAFEKWSAESKASVSSIRPQWKKGATDDYSVLEC